MYADNRDIIFECKGEPEMQPDTWEGTLRLLRNGDFCEVEVELKSGEDVQAVAFANILAEKYGLIPEHKSKYRRALGLARGE